ncbi:hypothetical protein I4F81_003456 [Pyropia yezoensis]|uniref:Uncharacterized protein n=1 Tax=Pyropia yezoensis TaxID=2788 RepID=A0ACC3BSZ5_PYRYE|nr:hypothetical protein I4F81_003456 [Neopyropia yezoensis]
MAPEGCARRCGRAPPGGARLVSARTTSRRREPEGLPLFDVARVGRGAVGNILVGWAGGGGGGVADAVLLARAHRRGGAPADRDAIPRGDGVAGGRVWRQHGHPYPRRHPHPRVQPRRHTSPHHGCVRSQAKPPLPHRPCRSSAAQPPSTSSAPKTVGVGPGGHCCRCHRRGCHQQGMLYLDSAGAEGARRQARTSLLSPPPLSRATAAWAAATAPRLPPLRCSTPRRTLNGCW